MIRDGETLHILSMWRIMRRMFKDACQTLVILTKFIADDRNKDFIRSSLLILDRPNPGTYNQFINTNTEDSVLRLSTITLCSMCM